MQPGETASRSALDKPLHQLTEDDISQLTREDCRRFLKDKGMRRPSWNKSQAIQQVISLKTLLETPPDSAPTEVPKRPHIPRGDSPPNPVPANPAVPVKGTGADTQISLSVEESVPNRLQELQTPSFRSDRRRNDNQSVLPRTTGTPSELAGQMAIFYCGKVNVYDDVPRDKAQAIMQLAASPQPMSQEASCEVIPAWWSFPCHLETPGVKAAENSPAVIFPTLQKVKGADNCQFSREESNISCEDNLGNASTSQLMRKFLDSHTSITVLFKCFPILL